MIDEALKRLGVLEFVISGEPTNEQEFLSMLQVVVGVDEFDSSILSNDPKDFGVTWDQVCAEIEILKNEYEANTYQRLRKTEYPSFADQFDTLYHGGYDAWKQTIQAIKDKYPKPS